MIYTQHTHKVLDKLDFTTVGYQPNTSSCT